MQEGLRKFKDQISDCLDDIISQVIPIITAKRANKVIKEKMEKITVEDIPDNNAEYQYLYEDYEFAKDSKKDLEDKAKIIIAAITIATSLILNLSSLIQGIYNNYCNMYIHWVIYIGTIISIVYMIIAGLSAIDVLTGQNKLFKLNSIDNQNKERKQLLYVIQLNNYQNIIRNNLIYSSYISIRNSLIILLVIFALSIWP